MDINQASQRAVINWQSFDVGADAKVHIVQPNEAATLLNRVVTNKPSEIYGNIDANGQVILVNNNGIVFGKDGSASASSFTATTLDISDQDFMDGKDRYSSNGAQGEIVNHGTIEAKNGGYVALLGAKVSNDGKIVTHNGTVALGAADSITIPMTSSGKIKMQLSAGIINAAVENTKNGVIVTEGGDVYLQAAAVNSAMASVQHSGQIDTSGEQAGKALLLADHGEISVEGNITANSSNAANKGGDIIIGRDSETGKLAKTTNVSAAILESKKGFVETSADLLATNGTQVKAAEWLLDPTNITIAASGASGTAYAANYTAGSDSVILASDINASLNAGTGVTIATSGTGASAGNIAVNESIAKTAGASSFLTLRAHNDITVAAGKTITSTAGNLTVTLNSDFDGNGSGTIAMAAGSGITSNGGNILLGGGSAGSATSYAAGYASVLSGVSLVSSNLTAGGGDISIKGKGNSVFTNTSSMRGVDLSGTTISTTGSGTITIDGVGGNGNVTNLNVGIGLTNNATITAGTGAITMTGTATTTAGGYYNSGIWLYGSGSKVTGAGAISLTGVGGGSTYASLNQGVRLEGGQVIATGTGTVTLNGTSGTTTGTAGPNAGVEISSSGVAKTDTGNISITGLSGTTGATDVLLSGAGSVSSNSGNVTFTANSYSGDNTEIVNAGTGIVTMQNRTVGTLIDVGGTDASGTLGISNAEIGRVTAGSIVIGSVAQQTGNLTVSSAIDTTGASNFSLISTGGIAVNNNIAKTTAGATTLNLQANSNIIVAANKTISSTSGALNTILNANSAGTGGGISFNSGSGITSNGGNITLGGGTALNGTGFALADATSTLQGISLTSAAFSAGGGNIVMNGLSPATTATNASNIAGILMTAGTITTTGAGVISLTGKNQIGTSTTGNGLVMTGTITGGSSGAVNIVGDSRPSTTGYTYIRGALINGTVTSTGGDINITGYAGQGAQYDSGLEIAGNVIAVGSGAINLSGTGSSGASGGNVGLSTSGTATISSVNGNINITGVGGTGNGAVIRDHGVVLGSSKAVQSTGTGNITIVGTVQNTDTSYSSGVLVNTGGLTTATGSIDITGTPAMNTQPAIGVSAALTAGGNVYLHSAGGYISTAATISGANVSIDETGGTINSTTGLITAGVASNGTNVSGDAIKIAAAINATGNVNIYGRVANTTGYNGVNLVSTGSITSTGAGAAINISSNGNVVNAGPIVDTASTGTGSTITLTSTTTGISGAGTIGDATNKNADVVFNQAGTSSYSGAINAKNFTKSGAGSLTLNSWRSLNLTNVANAYTVNGGGLTLDTDSLTLSYPWFAPAAVNVVNASSFTLSSSSNGRWNSTAFNFTGGLGGGTMNLGGNPIAAPGTTNTFSTSGGATNTINGGLNANSANVDLNLTTATSGTQLLDNSFAAINFASGYAQTANKGLGNATTITVSGGGSLLAMDTIQATNLNINAGYVQFGTNATETTTTTPALAVTNVNIAAGTTLAFNKAAASTNSSIYTGTGNLIQAGTGVVTLTGSSSAFAGATTVNAGKTLAIGTGGYLGAAGSTVTLTDATSNLSFTNTSGTSTVGSTISGLGTVTENGAGGIGLLLANNTYSGITTTTAGTLQVGNGGTVGSLGTGSVTDNSALVFNRSDNITVSNAIGGSGTVTQAGTGKLLFPSNNASYTGQTYVNSGILSFGTPSTTGTAATQHWSSQFNIAAGAVLDFNSPSGVTLNNQGTIFTGAGTITKTGAGGLTWNATDTFFNMLAGSLIDVQQGSMTGSTTYHGKWTNNLSSLNVAAGASFLGAEGDTRVDALTGAGTISAGWSTLGSMTVGVNNTAAGTYNTTAGTATFSGALSGPAPLNKIGTGTQILTGANTYTGATNITAGTLQVGDGGTTGTLGTGAVTDNGNLTINRSNAYTIANAISGTGTLNQIGTGTTILTATNTYSGTTTISAGTLQVGSGGAAGTLGTGAVVDNGILAINRSDAISLTQAISGTGSLLQMGTGTTKLASNNNTFSGGITIRKGAVMIGNGGGTNGNYNLNSGSGTITLGDANTGTSNVALQVESGTGLGQTALNNSIVVSSQGTGTATIGSVVGAGSGTYTEIRGQLTLNRDVILNDGTTDRLGYSGKITGTGNISITGNRVSMGTANANGISSNDFVGNVTIASGSTLQAGAKSLFPTTTNVINNGTLRLLDGAYQAINALSGTGTITTLNTSGGLVTDLSIGNNNGGATFSGTITGSSPVLTLTKNGTGTQILTGANSYTGATTINAGTLQIGNGSNTGTLGTNGTVYSAVSVAANANLDFYRNDIASTIPNNISGAGAVNFKGTGNQGQSSYSLTGNNSSLSGSINVLPSSRIAITAANQLGTAGITINSGAGMYTNGAFTINNAISLAGNGWNESTGYLGAIRLQNGTNYAGAITLAADARITAYGSTGTVSGVISGSKNLDFNSGTVTLTGNNTYTGMTTVSGGTLQVGNAGTTGTLGVGDVTLSNNSNLNYVRSAATTIANNISGTGNVSATITGATSDLTVDHTIGLTSGTVNLVTDANLLLSQAISTTNTTSSAILLNAGKPTAAGTSTGGDVQISGSGGLTVGAGGRATVMTGSILGSTGLATLVGSGSGRFRYKSDEATTNYSTALGAGIYGIYREAPTATITINNDSKTYNGVAYTGGNGYTLTAGGVNGDTAAQAGASIVYGGTAQNTKNIGSYSITNSSTASALGYNLNYVSGTLTVNQAALNVTATAVTKTYDGTTTATGTGTVGSLASAGDSVNSAGSQAFLDKNAGTGNKTVRASGVTIKDSSNADVTGNYAISYVDNLVSTINQAALTVTANAVTKTYDGTTTATGNGTVGTLAGAAAGELVNNLGSQVFTDKNVGTANKTVKASGVTIKDSSNADVTGNYAISYVDNAASTINQAALTVTANAVTKIYDGTTTATGNGTVGTLAGAAAGEAVNNLGTQVFTDKNVGTANKTVKASGVTIKDSSNADMTSNYNITYIDNTTSTINTKSVSYSGLGLTNKVYDGTTVASLNGSAALGSVASGSSVSTDGKVITSDTVSLTGTAAGTYTSKDVAATNNTVNFTGLSLTGTDASNYSLVQQSGLDGTGTITVKSVNYSGLGLTNKVYDGTTVASLNGSAALSNVASGSSVSTDGKVITTDTVSLTGTAAGTYTSKDVAATNNTVNFTGLSLTGSDASNYSLVQQSAINGTGTITVKSLTAAITASDKIYDGGDSATLTSTTSSNIVTGDTVNFSNTGAIFADKNVAYDGNGNLIAKTVTASGLSISGTDASNYSLTSTTATTAAKITPKSLAGSLIGTVQKVYDGLQNATLASSNYSLTGWVGSEGGTVTQTVGLYADKNVSANNGSGSVSSTLTASQVTANAGSLIGNYSVPTTLIGNVGKITPAALDIKVNNTSMFVTQNANNAIDMDYSYTGLVNGESAATALGAALTASDRIYVSSNAQPQAGNYSAVYGLVTTPTAVNGNYSINVVKGDLKVVAADKLLVSVTSQSDTYGNRDASSAAKANAGSVLAQYCLNASISCTGSNLVSLSMSSTNGINWSATDSTSNTITIDTAINTTGNLSTGGYLNFGNYTYGVTNVASSNSGQFHGTEINGGVLSINKLSITPTANAISRVYNASTLVDGMALNTLQAKSGDLLTASTAGGSFNDKNVQSNTTVTYSGLALDGADKNNYALSSSTINGLGSITAKTVSLAATKVYDGNTDMTGKVTVETGIAGEALNYSGATVNNKTVLGASYINAITLVDGTGLASNYQVTPGLMVGLNTASITPKALTASYTAQDKVYDGTSVATVTAGTTDIVGSDVVNINNSSALFDSKQFGTSKTVTVSVISLAGGDASNYALQNATAITHANISKAMLTVTANAVTKTYDGTTTASGNGTVGTLAGAGAGEVVNNLGSQVFTDKNIGTANKTVKASGVTIKDSGNADVTGNYAISYVDDTASTINQAALIVTANAVIKTYDGTTTATGNGTVGTLAGASAGEVVNNLGSQVFTDKNVGTANKTVKASGVTIKDSSNTDVTGNYAISYVDDTASTINQAALTVTANAVTKTYDGTTSATGNGTVGTLAGAAVGEVVNNLGSQVFTDKNVGTANKTVKASGVTIKDSGNADVTGNYAISYVDDTASTINQAALTVTANAVTKTYDGTTTATGNGTVGTLAGAGAGEVVNNLGSQVFTDKNVGTANKTVKASGVTIKDSGNLDVTSNYSISYIDNLASTINKANAVITANSDLTKVYNGVNQTVTGFTATGLVNGETENVLTGVSASGTGKNVGTYSVIASGTDSNYSLSFIDGSLKINKANAVVTANSDLTKVYNGVNQTVSGFTAIGLVNGETESVLIGVNAIGTGKNVGTYSVIASGTDSNYNLSFIDGSLKIDKANAVVTANSDLTKVYNGVNQTVIGFTAAGLVNGETESVLTGVSAIGTGKNAGTYSVIATGADSNYNLTFVDGKLIIDQASLQLQANDVTKTYDGTTTLAGIALTPTGVFLNDQVTVVANTGDFVSKDAGNAIGFSLSGLSLSGASASNYRPQFQTVSGFGSIAPKYLSVVGSVANNKNYDGNVVASIVPGVLSGLVGQESLDLSVLGTFINASVGSNKAVTAKYSLKNGNHGGLAANYVLGDETLYASIGEFPQVINPVPVNPSYKTPERLQIVEERVVLTGNTQLAVEKVTVTEQNQQAAKKNQQACAKDFSADCSSGQESLNGGLGSTHKYDTFY